MKHRLLYFLIFSVCFISCAEDDPEWKVTHLQLRNVNNAGEFPVFSDDSIRKEAYALDILYWGKNIKDKTDYSRIDFKNSKDTLVSQIIYCESDLSEQYKAGSDVTDLFKPIYGNSADVSNLDTKFHGGTFILKYMPVAGLHTFRVELTVGDGRIIQETTMPVKLY